MILSELLIVITIMGILTALVATNLYGARQRASDSQKKTNLRELKTALHLYYGNFHRYPNAAGNNGFNFYACGVSGDDFRLKINLQITSDVEIRESQARCPASACTGQSLSFGASDYVLCGN